MINIIQKFKSLLFCTALIATTSIAWAGTSILIWPIDPVLEDYQNSTAIWLENKGDTSGYFQIRAFKWRQEHNEDIYDNQKEIIASPLFALIEPGQKQLIRLVRDGSGKVAPGAENAYRIFVDEVPQKANQTDQQETDHKKISAGLQFQMRYSVPLFSNGKGIWTKEDYQNIRDKTTMSRPQLNYSITNKNGQTWISIHNSGAVHARLSKLVLAKSGSDETLMEGLIGYILPGSTMSWIIPKQYNINSQSKFKAKVNDDTDLISLVPQP